ncbi:hypothetical protein Bca52824_004259 [Brassica carinata]|uniref:Uncharacterized protein n=1 Tax=Brassica carinata TaxID=52824 RepID=A0A8X7WNT5_BRACI|nr:hypothetical protein Bca52824_004259 [Brassica carinata]
MFSFFPGKVSFPSSSTTSNGLKSTKTKHPALQVVCVSNNLSEEQRIKSELKTLGTKIHKEMRKGNVDVAVKLIQEKMARYLVTLTEAEAKKMARLSRGAFVEEAYERHLEAKTKAKPTTTPTAVVGRSTKKNRKQKIPPKEDKKEDAGDRKDGKDAGDGDAGDGKDRGDAGDGEDRGDTGDPSKGGQEGRR